MLLLGIDIGTSSIKVSVMDSDTQQCIASATFPETETGIIAMHPGWAEQSPEGWWEHVKLAILKMHAQRKYDPINIAAIGIAYQMHGLVLVDKDQLVLRNSIIWCDSRAVEIGDKAFEEIGKEKCLFNLLNSPGNFTASKLAWVKQNEPETFERTDKFMWPGDFIAMKFTGNITTSQAALSEGILWDFQKNEISKDVLSYYNIPSSMIPRVQPVFSDHGRVKKDVADSLSLKTGIPVTYKAGDQPNNALSLNVLEPGEVAASGGTSGVIYGVSDHLTFDNASRVNTFVHVGHTATQNRLGVLLCINGTGIMNSWMKKTHGNGMDYTKINNLASTAPAGSEGLMVFPFGNGAERMFNNKTPGAHINGLDLNTHGQSHLFRATQEGIAFAFRYGLDIMKENGMDPKVIRAGKANMFLSEVFTACFVNSLNTPVELYDSDSSTGAAIGAGIGAKIYECPKEAFRHFKPIQLVEPTDHKTYQVCYDRWLSQLQKHLN
jgi:xylulokinase